MWFTQVFDPSMNPGIFDEPPRVQHLGSGANPDEAKEQHHAHQQTHNLSGLVLDHPRRCGFYGSSQGAHELIVEWGILPSKYRGIMGIDRTDIYLAFPIIKPSPPPLLPDVRGAPGCFPWGRYHQSREKHLWELLVTGCADVFLAKFCEGRFIICPGMVTITKRTSRTVSWRKVWIHQIQNGCLSSLLACLHSCSFQCFSLNRNKIHSWWFCRKVSLPARVCPFSSLKTKSLSKTSPFLYASCKMLLDVQCGKKIEI